MRLLETFFQVLDKHRDKMELALTMADVERIVGAEKMAVILGLEAGWDFEGDLDILRLLHRFGLRLAQFTSHDVTNTYVDAVGGVKKWNGINQQGREIIREMNRLGIVIDISHASNESQLQIIEASAAPVTSSHQGLRHFVDTERTMPDETLKALARKGGVLGLHSSGAQISPTLQRLAARQANAREPADPADDAVRRRRLRQVPFGARCCREGAVARAVREAVERTGARGSSAARRSTNGWSRWITSSNWSARITSRWVST